MRGRPRLPHRKRTSELLSSGRLVATATLLTPGKAAMRSALCAIKPQCSVGVIFRRRQPQPRGDHVLRIEAGIRLREIAKASDHQCRRRPAASARRPPRRRSWLAGIAGSCVPRWCRGWSLLSADWISDRATASAGASPNSRQLSSDIARANQITGTLSFDAVRRESRREARSSARRGSEPRRSPDLEHRRLRTTARFR